MRQCFQKLLLVTRVHILYVVLGLVQSTKVYAPLKREMITSPKYLWVNPSSDVTYSSRRYVLHRVNTAYTICSAYISFPDCEAKEEDEP